MKIQEILITPSIAKKYLEANVKNRNIKKAVVLRYEKDMANGNWKENTGELIKLSKTGVVLDGQHRLMALIKANKSIYFHVATDLDDSIFDVLDTGSMRNAGDVFTINSIKNSCSVPSMIQMYEVLSQHKSITSRGVQINKKHTNSKLLELYHERPIFWDDVAKKSHTWYNAFAKVITPQLIGGVYAYLYDISPTDANLFMDQLCTGLDISNNTIGILRTKLIQDRLSVKKMPVALKNTFIIKTWNHFRNDVEVKMLRFDSEKELMPIAI